MPNVIIADTSCLVLLEKIGELPLLHDLFGEMCITPEVADEFKNDLPQWVKIVQPANTTYQSILEAALDKGEASAIALCLEQEDCLLIIDDNKGRKYAEQLKIPITGTLGVLIEAKTSGRVKELRPLLDKVKQTDFRLTDELIRRTLEIVKEL